MLLLLLCFFFKQKTAYEMRISDWSSDVCSSDLLDLSTGDLTRLLALASQLKADRRLGEQAPTAHGLGGAHIAMLFEKPSLRTRATFEIAIRELGGHQIGRAACGERGCQYV